MSASRAVTLVDAAADEFVGDEAEEPFDLVDPGRSGRGEVDVEPGMAGQSVVDQVGLWVA
jgi:hypothetical protein